MHPSFLLILVLGIAIGSVQADLVCLGWALISPALGVFCAFEPDAFHTAENFTVTAVESAVEDAKELVEFDLTHNPAVVTYNFIEQTNQGGIQQGVQYLGNTAGDFKDVTVGFAKGTANQAVQIFELIYWNDVSYCMIKGATNLVASAKKSRKRAGLPSSGDAVIMAQGCLSEKFKKIASPAVFNITEPNQQVGSTISNIAGMLVPIGLEGEVAADVTKGAVDLAIPGSEATTRVLKKIGEDGTAAHFTNEAEGIAVIENMRDESWVDANCGLCQALSVASSDLTILKRRRRRTDQLRRRGSVVSLCCRAPAVIPDLPITYDVPLNELELEEPTPPEPAQEAEIEPFVKIYDTVDYDLIKEADLTPSPDYVMRDLSVDADLAATRTDLNSFDTSVVAWSPDLKAAMSSQELFSMLRKMFENPTTDELYKLLPVNVMDELNGEELRMEIHSVNFMDSTEPAVKPLQDFVTASIQQGKDIVSQVKGLSAEDAEQLTGFIDFYWVKPSQEALTGTDPRGFHIDGGMMQLIAMDTPGLIVSNAAKATASRPPVQEDAFLLVKAINFDDPSHGTFRGGATRHSVFGPEMAEHGRVSMVMDIFMEGEYFKMKK